jgi:hypothetical protein
MIIFNQIRREWNMNSDNNFTRKLIRIVLFLLTLISFTVSTSSLNAQQDQNEELIIATSPGELYFEEILKKMLAKIGENLNITFKVQRFPKERSLIEVNTGRIAGEGHRVKDLAKRSGGRYPNIVRIDEPYATMHFSAFVTDPNIEITRWEDLGKGYRVGIVRGNKTAEKRLEEYVSEKNRDMNNVHDYAFKKLVAGRIDIVVMAAINGARYMKHYDNVYMKGKFEIMDIYMYLNKKYKDIVPLIESEIRSMKADGTLDAIEQKIRMKIIEGS